MDRTKVEGEFQEEREIFKGIRGKKVGGQECATKKFNGTRGSEGGRYEPPKFGVHKFIISRNQGSLCRYKGRLLI